jgi:hypothetical protein
VSSIDTKSPLFKADGQGYVECFDKLLKMIEKSIEFVSSKRERKEQKIVQCTLCMALLLRIST